MKSPVNAALIALAVSSAQYAAAQDCRPITVGVDTSLANNSVVIATYEAVGEIFFARDTLVRSLTVWRVASEAGSVIGLRAYIVGTYSSGTPDITQLLWESAPLVKQGDGVHPTQFTWEMDPPLALPHRGQYAFYIYYSLVSGMWISWRENQTHTLMAFSSAPDAPTAARSQTGTRITSATWT